MADVKKAHDAFFADLPRHIRSDPTALAREYALALVEGNGRVPLAESKIRYDDRGKYHVGLNVKQQDFEDVTKRATLVSDVLMLSHEPSAKFIELDRYMRWLAGRQMRPNELPSLSDPYEVVLEASFPDMDQLGRWILESEPLMRAGTLWYLPTYRVTVTPEAARHVIDPTPNPIDLLVRDRRAVDASGTAPVKSKVIRPILEMEIPYIDGVSLREFGKITAGEFNSYELFRDSLRQKLLEMDFAMNDTDSQRKLAALEQEIRAGVGEVRAKISNSKRTRWWAGTGAVACVATVILFAIQDLNSAFIAQAGLSTVGAGSAFKALTEENRRKHDDGKWYYVWALMDGGQTF
jgi:hypothetical protein